MLQKERGKRAEQLHNALNIKGDDSRVDIVRGTSGSPKMLGTLDGVKMQMPCNFITILFIHRILESVRDLKQILCV